MAAEAAEVPHLAAGDGTSHSGARGRPLLARRARAVAAMAIEGTVAERWRTRRVLTGREANRAAQSQSRIKRLAGAKAARARVGGGGVMPGSPPPPPGVRTCWRTPRARPPRASVQGWYRPEFAHRVDLGGWPADAAAEPHPLRPNRGACRRVMAKVFSSKNPASRPSAGGAEPLRPALISWCWQCRRRSG